VVREVAGAVAAQLLERQAARLGVPPAQLFPQWPALRAWLLPAAAAREPPAASLAGAAGGSRLL